jgi:threonine/homoserine/homoserine lactone efflux protein
MIKFFLFSTLAGIILAAPVGPTGAMVADAALAHDRKRLEMTVLGAVAGNALLAFIVSLSAGPIKAFLAGHERSFHIGAGIFIIMLGIFAGAYAAAGGAHKKEGGPAGALGLGASSAGVLLITLLHPGSIAAFLFLTAFFSVRFSGFPDHRVLFVSGIAVGSLMAFSPVGFLFWTIREKAEKFVLHLRYGLAVIIGLTGIYCLTGGVYQFFEK